MTETLTKRERKRLRQLRIGRATQSTPATSDDHSRVMASLARSDAADKRCLEALAELPAIRSDLRKALT